MIDETLFDAEEKMEKAVEVAKEAIAQSRVLLLVIGFESSGALASAYGVSVSGTMLIDTLLLFTEYRASGALRAIAVATPPIKRDIRAP